MNKTLDAWLSWQETLHPEEIELGLARIREVAVSLNLLTPQAKVVTVAGTNGKGSSIAILESITRSAGLAVGVYISPHLLRYNERIRINGELATDAMLCEAFEQIDRARGDTSLTYFEFGTLAAFYLFQQHALDLWILEVGLGGRLDAVNLMDADVALLTTVDLDHQAWLGESREEIGREKAGVFREGCPAVVGERNPPNSVLNQANRGVPLRRLGRAFDYSEQSQGWRWQPMEGAVLEQLPYPNLVGAVQLQNSAAVLEVIAQLGWMERIGEEAIREGLAKVTLPGRFETIATAPEVIVDVSHNPQAAAVLAANLQSQSVTGKRWAVVGMLNDKEVSRVIEAVAPEIDRWIVGGLELPRGLSEAELGAIVQQIAGESVVESAVDIATAFQQVRRQAAPEDQILVFGSFYTVAAVLQDQ